MNTAFTELTTLTSAEIDNLNQLGFSQMTAIQAKALPHALANKDLIAQAQTGSGKTAAFGIGLLHKLNPRFFGVQGLVLCPTRELANQVAEDLRKLARFQANIKIVVLCGGVSIGPQIASMEKGAHVVVGTPGRIKDHLRKNTLQIDQLQTLVLDEADRMLDMGFREDIEDIANNTPNTRQTLLFSATFPDNIAQLSQNLQNQPVSIKVESTHNTSSIEQQSIRCESQQKTAVLLQAISHFSLQQSVIFCNTKQKVDEVAQLLSDNGYLALALHGDLEQRDRDEIYARFKNLSAHFLVATDVAARGLDVDDLASVINYDLPRDPEVYIHRIGRTGRAGKSGLALSLISDKETRSLADIEALIENKLPQLSSQQLQTGNKTINKPPMITLCLAAGRRDKLRPGDIVGAITNTGQFSSQDIGKIDVLNTLTYVAIKRANAKAVIAHLQQNKIKNRSIKVRLL